MKKLSDYIHLYIGCDYTLRNDATAVVNKLKAEYIGTNGFTDVIVPLLRPLSDMTEEEATEVCKLSKWCNHPDNIEVLFDVDAKKIHFVDGTMDCGDGWSEQSDLYVYFNELNAEQVRYLLSRGFDIFNLIPEGLALDKTLTEKTV